MNAIRIAWTLLREPPARVAVVALFVALLTAGCGSEKGKADSESTPGAVTTEDAGSAPAGDAQPSTDLGGAGGEAADGAGSASDAGFLTPERLALLGRLQVDEEAGFEFRAPVVFERAADEFVAQARSALGQTPGSDGPYFTLPRMVFAVPGTEARIFVGEFVQQSVPDVEAWTSGYIEAAQSKATGARFQQDRLHFAGQDLLFVRIESAAFRNDRVVVTTGKGVRLQVDYLLPAVSLPDIGEAVAVSIATIRTR